MDDINKTKNSREKEIIKVSILNITVNLLLSVFKGTVGFLSHSVAIQADAINSLSDALAAVITIIGIKLSGKEPNEKHPLGYGRYEFLSDGIVSFLVLYAGIITLIDSIKKIINPEQVDYSNVTIIILIVAIIAKIFLGVHEKSKGKKFNSKALQSSGIDSISDAVVTSTVLISALLYIFSRINVEAYLGVVISFMIIKSGFEMFRDTIDEILGKRVKSELIKAVKDTLNEDENVFGAYDMILHSYGPEKYIGSVHIEVPSDMKMEDLDILQRKLTSKVYKTHGVFLSGIGIYSVDVENRDVIELRENINSIVQNYDHVLQLHGFVVDMDKRKIRFDLIIDFIKDSNKLVEDIKKDINRMYPDFDITIQKDLNVDL